MTLELEIDRQKRFNRLYHKDLSVDVRENHTDSLEETSLMASSIP